MITQALLVIAFLIFVIFAKIHMMKEEHEKEIRDLKEAVRNLQKWTYELDFPPAVREPDNETDGDHD